MPRNLEIKLACTPADIAGIAARFRDRDVNSAYRLHHIDTYFGVPHGRLKLRRVSGPHGESAELIQYSRANTSGARSSTYHRISVSAGEADELLVALSASLGVISVVHKQRNVAIWRSTRIHLDEVESLGRFVELETMVRDEGGGTAAQEEFVDVMEWLQLGGLTSIPGSYCDLMTAETPKP